MVKLLFASILCVALVSQSLATAGVSAEEPEFSEFCSFIAKHENRKWKVYTFNDGASQLQNALRKGGLKSDCMLHFKK